MPKQPVPKHPKPIMSGEVFPTTFYAAGDDQQMILRNVVDKLSARILTLLTNDSPEAAEFRRVALETPSEGYVRVIHLFLRADVRDIGPSETDA